MKQRTEQRVKTGPSNSSINELSVSFISSLGSSAVWSFAVVLQFLVPITSQPLFVASFRAEESAFLLISKQFCSALEAAEGNCHQACRKFPQS